MSDHSSILLVGGNGFLGKALAHALAEQGRDVHVLARHVDSGHDGNISTYQGDQDDPEIVMPLLEECGEVVHLASTSTPGSTARTPVLEVEENLTPTVQFIETMASRPPRRVLFLSSGGAVYGDCPTLPVDESVIPGPLSYHAAGKVAIESFFSAFAHGNDVSLAVLRPSNLYGPGQPLRPGFGIVRTLLERVKRGQQAEIWGDGTTVRDYLFVDDAVSACLKLLADDRATGTFNLGSGIGTSVNELVSLIERVTGQACPVLHRPSRKTDVRAIVLHSERLRTTVGWTPDMDLEEGLRWTWAWLRDRQT